MLVLLAWLALFFLLGFTAWNFQGGELMMIAFFVISALSYIVYAFMARCPHCRMPLLLKPVRLLGMEIFTWSLLTPDRCRHCGEKT